MQEFTFASEEQKWFWEAGPQPTLFFTGYGGGKSVIGVMKLLYLLSQYPNSRGAIVRRTFSQLTKTTVMTLKQWLPTDRVLRWNEQQGIIELTNGSIIYLLYLDSPDSLNVLRGLEINFCFVDQAEELSEEAWDLLDTRCGRWSGAEREGGWPKDWHHKDASGRPLPPKYLFAATNAPGFDSWVFKRFAPDSPDRAYWRKQGYRTIVASSRKNKFLGEQNLKTLLSKGEDFIKRYVDATEWGMIEGLIVDISPLSLIDPDANPGLLQKIKSSMKLHRSLDHGETAPTCCLWHATDHDGNIFTYKEYYQPNLLVSQHRQNIFELSKEDATMRTENILPRYYSELADPSIFSVSRGRSLNEGPRWSVADEYSDTQLAPKETVINWTPADNNEEATRSRMKEYLRVDPEHRHPVTGELGSPRLFFIIKTDYYPNGVDETLRDIRSQKRVELGTTTEGKKIFSEDRDEKIRDHGWDACLVPDTRVLKADLTWASLGSLVIGDKLLAFDEDAPASAGGRKWRFATVASTTRIYKPCYKITLSDGTCVTCSSDHRWLTRAVGSDNVFWQTAESLDGLPHRTKGRKRDLPSGDAGIVKLVQVHTDLGTNDSGYLAAAFDGEGCLGHKGQLTFAQRSNPMLTKVIDLLGKLNFGFRVGKVGNRDCMSLSLRGGFAESLRFLMQMRPVRLISRLKDGQRLKTGKAVYIIKREFVGEQEVVALGTTTSTFIAEGLASHNCKYFVCSRPSLGATPPQPKPAAGWMKISDYDSSQHPMAVTADDSYFEKRGWGR